MNNRDIIRLYELVALEFEGDLSTEQFLALNNMLKDKEYAHKYVELVSMLSELSGQSRVDISLDGTSDNTIQNEKDVRELLREIVNLEDNAPAIKIETEEKPDAKIVEKGEARAKKSSRFFKFFDKFVYLAAAFMVIFIVYAELFSPQYTVAVGTVVDQVGVKWEKGSGQLKTSQQVLTNQFPYKLKKGIIKIRYDQGVDVLVEGPAKFIFERNGLDLVYGKVYSYVSEAGRGFTVDTPNTRFVDLGTEFGVSVDKDSASELHVLKGEVQYFSGLSGAPKASKIIRQNNARRFNFETGEVQPIPLANEYFVRQVDSGTGLIWRGREKLDLTQIVAGKTDSWKIGDVVGINPLNGKYINPDYRRTAKTNNQYNIFDSSEFIDGVFIPDGGNGQVTISSAGDKFLCPDTSGDFSNNICLYRSGVVRKNSKISPLIFDGKNIEENPESIICFHSNCGITIDLEAIRNTMPGHEFSRFKSTAGITEFVGNLKGRAADVDVFMLVDGQAKFKRELVMVKDGSFDIDFELADKDRFLTIIVTDGLRDTDASQSGAWANDFFYLLNPEIILQKP